MLKELLLQFVISLIPVFSFQLWHYKQRKENHIRMFITATSAIAMIACMSVSTDFNGYELNFRFVPFILGSLYGGVYGALVLDLLYIFLRVPALDTDAEKIVFVFFMFVHVPIILLCAKRFGKKPLHRKRLIGVKSITPISAYITLMFVMFMMHEDFYWSTELVAVFILLMIGSIVAIWLSIFIVEKFVENSRLQLELKNVSSSYRLEVEKQQQFIDEMLLAILFTDEHGVITHLNAKGKELFQRQFEASEDLFSGNVRLDTFFAANEDGAYIKLLEDALAGAKSSTGPHTEDGKTLLKTAFAIRRQEDHSIAGAALIVQDVTELTLLRDELGRMERLSLIGQMAASITHEIRNPMAVIRGFMQLMRERSRLNEQQYYQIVMEELDRANTIISDFLSLAQNRSVPMEKHSLQTIIQEILPLLQADANLRGQVVQTELADELPSFLMSDKEMKQLLINLVRNGMEAMGEKGVLHIFTGYLPLENKVVLRIRDNGVGIPAEQMSQLFKPFYTTKSKGTGLGLPLCLSIAERHNGKLEVESEEGEGTTFILTFMLGETDAFPAL
ncbi:ATP-binding protein [Paenibacillus algorifonticola]|uniref:ATP-binding protein n=1 Tax=Paenibacillus algorifonticola TaxID=684063 RepID=UPI003D2A69B0